MKKLITFLAIVLTLSVSAQNIYRPQDFKEVMKIDAPKDSVKLDTAFVFSVQEIQMLSNILMESNVSIGGKPATGKELSGLIEWLYKHGQVFKKEQPKK